MPPPFITAPVALNCRYHKGHTCVWSLKLLFLASWRVLRITGFQAGKHFLRVGSEENNDVQMPIFTDARGSVALDHPPMHTTWKEDITAIPGAFILRNVLSRVECSTIIDMAEAMGFAANTPTLKGEVQNRFRGRFDQLRAPRCVWLATEAVNSALFARLRHFLPQSSLGGTLHGINRRWRIYRYQPGQQFVPHLDDGYEASYLNKAGSVATDPTKQSLLTILVYLSSGLQGGQTRFWIPDSTLQDFSERGVRPVAGHALLFFHGDHPLSLIHEGCPVREGVKYVLRSDVLYEREMVVCADSSDFQGIVQRWPHIYAGRLKWQQLSREP